MKKVQIGFLPKIPEYFDIVIISENKIMFRSPNRRIFLEGTSINLIKKLIPYFNGNLNIEKIKQKTALSKNKIEAIVSMLKEKELIFDANKTEKFGMKEKELRLYQEQVKFFSRTTQKDHTLRYSITKKLADSSILLIGGGAVGSHLLSIITSMGIGKIMLVDNEKVNHADVELGYYDKNDIGKLRCKALKNKFSKRNKSINIKYSDNNVRELNDILTKNFDLVVLCSDTFSPETHHLVNEICFKNNQSWISARISDDLGEVGPLIIPKKTSCFRCYDYRTKSLLEKEDLLSKLAFEKYLKNKKENYGGLTSFYGIIAGYLSLEIIKMLTDYDEPTTIGSILSINFKNYESQIYPVLKIPHCPVCKGV